MTLIGQRIEGLQILRQLGRGAVADVYLLSDGHKVKALKLFPEDARARAEHELRLGQLLDHPNLNPVEALVELAARPGLIMAYVSGEPLGRYLQRAPGLAARLEVMTGVFAALEHLHSRGILHRDVKPENIIVYKRHATLIDYDLATTEGVKRSRVEGTLAYLSPELARGDRAQRASDLYAAGVVLYQVLTGEPPFDMSEESRVLVKPSQLDAALEPFNTLITCLLADAPEARPSSAADVMEVLSELGHKLSVREIEG